MSGSWQLNPTVFNFFTHWIFGNLKMKLELRHFIPDWIISSSMESMYTINFYAICTSNYFILCCSQGTGTLQCTLTGPYHWRCNIQT